MFSFLSQMDLMQIKLRDPPISAVRFSLRSLNRAQDAKSDQMSDQVW